MTVIAYIVYETVLSSSTTICSDEIWEYCVSLIVSWETQWMTKACDYFRYFAFQSYIFQYINKLYKRLSCNNELISYFFILYMAIHPRRSVSTSPRHRIFCQFSDDGFYFEGNTFYFRLCKRGFFTQPKKMWPTLSRVLFYSIA